MGYRAFLTIKDFYGKGSDLRTPLLTFSWGSSSGSHVGDAGSWQSSDKVQVTELTVSRETDSDSPKIFHAVATGKHFDKAFVTMEVEGFGGWQQYSQYELSDVILNSYRSSPPAGSPPKQIENLTLNFGKLNISYAALRDQSATAP